MVRDPSIVSPSLTGVFIGGGHNKHQLQVNARYLSRFAECGAGGEIAATDERVGWRETDTLGLFIRTKTGYMV